MRVRDIGADFLDFHYFNCLQCKQCKLNISLTLVNTFGMTCKVRDNGSQDVRVAQMNARISW